MNLDRLRSVPFFRWSFLRMVLGMRHLLKEWQVGDGREEAAARYVEKHARRGSPDDVVRVIDEFAYRESFLINVGDEKGKILDEAVRRARPGRILELGAYCGYSAVRMAACAPAARITSIELNPANAAIARRVLDHAGVGDRVQVVVGTLGDGATVRALEAEHGLSEGALDLVFLDHAKEAYLPDLMLILEKRWLRPGALAVADNVKLPGAPEYRAYMKKDGRMRWRTTEHRTHAEYQKLFSDLVLVSELIA
jgi:catechol O-methyltransferase